MCTISISVQTEDFNLGDEYARIRKSRSDIGAVVGFVGLVRDLNLGGDIQALELQHYPGMTEKALATIANDAVGRWPLQGIAITHRVGRLLPNDQIVMVLTASAHRHAAYDANIFIMDFLKTKAPFWKREWADGGAHWVDARDSDISAADRWHQLVAGHYGNVGHD